MSTRTFLSIATILSPAILPIFAGCSKSPDQPASNTPASITESGVDVDPHDVPITEQQEQELRRQTAQFADAVAMIKQLRDEVEQETAAGIPANPFQAHQALDKADLVLQWLPEITRNSDITKENWEAVNTSANDLRTLFEQVHQNIDEKQDPNFAAVADAIDRALAGLQQIAADLSSGAAAEN